MKHLRLLSIIPMFALVACNSGIGSSASLQENLKNPLFAKSYYTDLTGQMVSFTLQKDEILKDARKKGAVERARVNGVQSVEEAQQQIDKGMRASIVSDRDMAIGTVLLVDNVLHFGPDFVSSPGPSLHVYLSDTVDPRLVRFPDSSAVDLGLLQNPYGAQSFVLPEGAAPAGQRKSVALWDDSIGTLYGFAQLSE